MFGTNINDKNVVENEVKTHLVINVNNRRTLRFCRTNKMKYSSIVSSGEEFIVLVWLSGESQLNIDTLFLVFKRKSCNYLMCGVPDDINDVRYGTDAKDWIDATVMPQCI